MGRRKMLWAARRERCIRALESLRTPEVHAIASQHPGRASPRYGPPTFGSGPSGSCKPGHDDSQRSCWKTSTCWRWSKYFRLGDSCRAFPTTSDCRVSSGPGQNNHFGGSARSGHGRHQGHEPRRARTQLVRQSGSAYHESGHCASAPTFGIPITNSR
jgi:hypothetical protein